MSEFNKYSTDGGATFIDVEDSNAVHWGDQSKGYVGKNLFENIFREKYGSNSYTINGLTFVLNDDKTVTISGIAEAETTLWLSYSYNDVKYDKRTNIHNYIPNGTYIWSGVPNNTSGVVLILNRIQPSGSPNYAMCSGTEVLFTRSDSEYPIGVALRVYNETDLTTPVTVSPMLRYATITDNTYEEFMLDNKQLKQAIMDLNCNLLKNTSEPSLLEYNIVSGGGGVGSIETINDSPVPDFNKSLRITGNTTGNRDFSYNLSSKLPHGYYRFRVFARSLSGTVTAYIRLYGGTHYDSAIKIIDTSWTLIDTILDASIFTDNIRSIQFGITNAGGIEFIKPELFIVSKEELKTLTLNGASNFAWFGVADGTYNNNGIDYIVNNSEGSVVLNGTTTGQSTCILNSTNKKMKLRAGKYKISGMDKGGAYLTFNRPSDGSSGMIALSEGTQSHAEADSGYGCTFSATNDTDFGTTGNFFIRIDSANVKYDNVKIYPRIELLSTDCADDDFQAYTMTNNELTDKVQGIINAATNAADFAAFKTAISNL